MKISALLVQFPVTLSVKDNLAAITHGLKQAIPGDLVVCPEGCLSGYERDVAFLGAIDQPAVADALQKLEEQVMEAAVHLWLGACVCRDGNWYNMAFGLTPHGEILEYAKVNLATHERGKFTAGDSLPVFRLNFPPGQVAVGVQVCRELRFPEQWGWLARQGAQVFLHLNNAVGNSQNRTVWRSHLISRAAETGRFVLSANNGAPGRQCPSMAVAPDGQMLGEIGFKGASTLHVSLDLSRVSDWYISQSRHDVVRIRG